MLRLEILVVITKAYRIKRGKNSPSQIHRYLWYRQAAKALGWRDRQKFPVEIEDLLKARVWPDGEAQMRNEGQIDIPNNSHKTNVGIGAAGGGLAAFRHVAGFVGEWGDVVHTHIKLAARKGSPGEEHIEESGTGSTSAEEPVSACVRGCGSGARTNSANPFRTSAENKEWDRIGGSKRRRARGGIDDGQACRSETNADENKCDRSVDARYGGEWTAKRSRVERHWTGVTD